MKLSLALVAPIALIFVQSVGCSHDQPPPMAASDAVGSSQPTAATVVVPPAPHTDQVVNVGPNLRKACAIDDVAKAPKFDFDKSKLSSNDRDILGQVAVCLTTGPMKGRPVSLVGRADPRGESEYNMNLGEQRAISAKNYLGQLGVDASRIRDTSRGALDAVGHDEGTWRQDRRVDIELAD